MLHQPSPLGPMELFITAPPLADIDEVLAYIRSRASVEAAIQFADQIDRELFHLADIGHIGVAREWLGAELRMTKIGDCCVYFRVSANETRTIRLLRGSRDISRVLFESSFASRSRNPAPPCTPRDCTR